MNMRSYRMLKPNIEMQIWDSDFSDLKNEIIKKFIELKKGRLSRKDVAILQGEIVELLIKYGKFKKLIKIN